MPEMPAADYQPFMLIDPGAPVMFTSGVAKPLAGPGDKLVMIIVETSSSSSRYFLPIEIAEALHMQIGESIKEASSPLEIVKNNLFVPLGKESNGQDPSANQQEPGI